jgi:hypothetical protein
MLPQSHVLATNETPVFFVAVSLWFSAFVVLCGPLSTYSLSNVVALCIIASSIRLVPILFVPPAHVVTLQRGLLLM